MTALRRPKIAIDFSGLDSLNQTNGQYHYGVNLVRGLAELQPDVDFLLLGAQDIPVPELRGVFERYGDRWDYRQLPRRKFRGAYYVDHARYSWVLLRERVSLLHALHTLIPLLASCPVVSTIYDLMFELFDDYAQALRSRPYRIHKWAVRHLTRRIICISQTTAVDLCHLWKVSVEKVDVVPLGTNFLRRDNGNAQLSRVTPAQTHLTLLSPYNLEPRKNLKTLLEATALLSSRYHHLKLVLFGGAALTPEREESFIRLTQQLNIQEQVVRVGVVTHEELAALYHQATLFVFPSLYEGFGLPLLEAISSGACVVAHSASAMAEVVGDAGLLVDTNSPAALAEGIEKLLTDRDLREMMGRRAEARAAQFNVRRMAQDTYHCYMTALGKHDDTGSHSTRRSGAVRA